MTSRPLRACAGAVALALFALSTPALAQEPASKPLSVSWKLDGSILGAAAVGVLVPEFAKASFAPEGCRWCHRSPDGGVDVNGFDGSLRGAFAGAAGIDPPAWARTSDLFAFALLPALAVLGDLHFANGWQFDRHLAADLVIVAESVFVAAAVNQSVKFAMGRQRPFVAYDSPFAGGLRHGTETGADDNLSFYSGHASAAMSVTMAMARVIELRTGKKTGYLTLVPLGIATGLMRMAADKHWGSDVITGMAFGAAFGYVLPTLHAD